MVQDYEYCSGTIHLQYQSKVSDAAGVGFGISVVICLNICFVLSCYAHQRHTIIFFPNIGPSVYEVITYTNINYRKCLNHQLRVL